MPVHTPTHAKMDTNGSPTAPHGLILSEDEATASGMPFIRVLGLFDVIIVGICFVRNGPSGDKAKSFSPNVPMKVALSTTVCFPMGPFRGGPWP